MWFGPTCFAGAQIDCSIGPVGLSQSFGFLVPAWSPGVLRCFGFLIIWVHGPTQRFAESIHSSGACEGCECPLRYLLYAVMLNRFLSMQDTVRGLRARLPPVHGCTQKTSCCCSPPAYYRTAPTAGPHARPGSFNAKYTVCLHPCCIRKCPTASRGGPVKSNQIIRQ